MPIHITVPFEQLADDIEQEVDRKYRGFLLTIFNNLTLKSPVLSGRYKANHTMSINTPSNAVDGSMGFVAPATGTFPTVYFQNNLPYATVVEFGRGRRLPRYVYQQALQDALASF